MCNCILMERRGLRLGDVIHHLIVDEHHEEDSRYVVIALNAKHWIPRITQDLIMITVNTRDQHVGWDLMEGRLVWVSPRV